MKHLRWSGILLIALLLSLSACGKNEGAPAESAKSAVTQDDAVVELKNFDWESTRGKVVFLEFWGTWCGPCIRSMPTIQKHFEHYRNNPNFMLMAINTGSRGDTPEKLRQWHKSNDKYTFPIYHDSGRQQSSKYQVTGIPRSVILDKQGNIAYSGHPMQIPPDLLEKLINS